MTPKDLDPGKPIRRIALFVLLGCAFAFKLLVVYQLKDHPLTQPDAGLDTTAYANLANRVLGGDIALGPGLYFVSPLYIYFLAACLAVFHSYTAVRLVQIALGTASIGFIFLSARLWFGERAGWAAASLAALTGLFTFYEALILQSSIDAFLTSAALYALARGLLGLPSKDLPSDQPPPRLRRSAEASAKAEGGSYMRFGWKLHDPRWRVQESCAAGLQYPAECRRSPSRPSRRSKPVRF